MRRSYVPTLSEYLKHDFKPRRINRHQNGIRKVPTGYRVGKRKDGGVNSGDDT